VKEKVWVVMPCFESDQRITETLNNWISHFQRLNVEATFCLVDDHSEESRWKKLIHQLNGVHGLRAEVFRLKRNYGQPFATCIGVAMGKGEVVYTTDDDLKVGPKFFENLYSTLISKQLDYGFITIEREFNGVLDRLGSQLFNRFWSWWLNYPVHGSNHRVILGSQMCHVLQKGLHRFNFLDPLLLKTYGKGQFFWVAGGCDGSKEGKSRHGLIKKIRMTFMTILSLSDDRLKKSLPEVFLQEKILIEN